MKPYIFVILCCVLISLLGAHFVLEFKAINAFASETIKAEYGIRKTYDEDAICYTAFMQNGLESGISISCIPRPQTCDYQNKKGTQNAWTISTKTNSYNTK